jgi:hypothetical protein
MNRNRVAGLTGCLMVLVMAGHAQSPTLPIPVSRVAEDARVLDRVAEASKRDLPTDLLRRIVDEDIDALRGKRTDDTYQYAGYERMEAVRTTESYSVDPERADQLSKLEVRGDFAYRLIVTSPSRRLVVTKNRRVWLDHAEIEYLPQGSRFTKVQTVKLGVWLDPAGSKTVEFDEIARHATARLYAKADKDAGYGNVDLTLVEARVFDDPSSPYADAVSSLKAIHRALDHEDIASVRTMSQRIVQELGGVSSATAPPEQARGSVDVVAPQPAEAAAPSHEVYGELQSIEDLLTGSDAERRQGLDRLHQLVRKLRSQSH